VSSVTDQVSDNPMFLPDLEVLGFEADKLGAPKPTPDQQRQNGSIALTANGFRRKALQQLPDLLDGEPIADPHAETFGTLNVSDAGGQARTQQARIGSFVSQAPDSGQADVDGGGSAFVLLQEEPIREHNCPVESQARLQAVPADEFVYRVAVRHLRTRGWQ
jgi:hypothetical protein